MLWVESDLRTTKLYFILDLIWVNVNATWKTFYQQELAIQLIRIVIKIAQNVPLHKGNQISTNKNKDFTKYISYTNKKHINTCALRTSKCISKRTCETLACCVFSPQVSGHKISCHSISKTEKVKR